MLLDQPQTNGFDLGEELCRLIKPSISGPACAAADLNLVVILKRCGRQVPRVAALRFGEIIRSVDAAWLPTISRPVAQSDEEAVPSHLPERVSSVATEQ